MVVKSIAEDTTLFGHRTWINMLVLAWEHAPCRLTFIVLDGLQASGEKNVSTVNLESHTNDWPGKIYPLVQLFISLELYGNWLLFDWTLGLLQRRELLSGTINLLKSGRQGDHRASGETLCLFYINTWSPCFLNAHVYIQRLSQPLLEKHLLAVVIADL